VLDAKVAEGMVIGPQPAAEPLVGVVTLAEPREVARGSNALTGGVEPDGQEDLGIERGPPRLAAARGDGGVETRQV
jgi:hypothetical protein